MQIASLLSDLTSLRVCDHSAALALVSVYKIEPQSSKSVDQQESNVDPDEGSQGDEDMQRAIDLVNLHYDVKVKHMRGENAGLKQARADVDRVLRKLEGENLRHS